MFKELALIFGSKIKAQEMVLLLQNVKEAVRQGFFEAELQQVERFCREHGFYLVKSRFKVLLADEGKCADKGRCSNEVKGPKELKCSNERKYSNKGIRIPEDDPRPGMYFVYLSKDEQKAWLASYYELVQNHIGLGMILGYPSCCVDYFCRNFTSQNSDLEIPSQNPYTNLSKRHQDLVILSHFPCRNDCKESLVLGKIYLQAIKRVDKSRAEELLIKLREE